MAGTNLFASRISYDLTLKLRLGSIVTNGHPDGVTQNTLARFDAVYRTSEFLGNKNFLIGVWGAFASGDLRPGDRAGWGFKIDYPNDRWDCFTAFNRYGEALEPGLGFLPRPGVHRFDGRVRVAAPAQQGRSVRLDPSAVDGSPLHARKQFTRAGGMQRFTWVPVRRAIFSPSNGSPPTSSCPCPSRSPRA